MKKMRAEIDTYKCSIGQKTEAFNGRQINGPIGDAQHDQRLCVVAVEVEMIAFLREARRHSQDAAGELLRQRAIIRDLVTLKTPDGLPVTELEIEVDAVGHVRSAWPQVGQVRVEHGRKRIRRREVGGVSRRRRDGEGLLGRRSASVLVCLLLALVPRMLRPVSRVRPLQTRWLLGWWSVQGSSAEEKIQLLFEALQPLILCRCQSNVTTSSWDRVRSVPSVHQAMAC